MVDKVEDVKSTPPAALQLSEDSILAELSILDYYLHQSLTLRLNNLFPVDPFQNEAERKLHLKRAQYSTEMVGKMLQYLKLTFGEDYLPFDSSLTRRLNWAKFIGLLFFCDKDGDCWDGITNDNGPNEGLLSAYHLFPRLFAQPSAIVEQGAAMQMMIELKTQIIVQVFLKFSNSPTKKAEILNILLPTWNNESIPELKDHLPKDPFTQKPEYTKRSANRLEALQEFISNNQSLPEKFPYTDFARQMNGFLRNIYRDYMEVSIISKYCEKLSRPSTAIPQIGSIENRPAPIEKSTQPSLSITNNVIQMDFLTQPPAVLLSSSSPSSRVPTDKISNFTFTVGSNPEDTIQPAQHQSIVTSFTPKDFQIIGNDKMNDDAPSFATPRPRLVDDELRVALESSLDLPATLPNLSVSGSIENNINVLNLDVQSPEKPSSNETIPLELKEFIEGQGAKIPAHAFRAVLCKNDDAKLANIIEGSHPLVRKFYSENVHETIERKRPKNILERHDSAEKIPWSSDLLNSPPLEPLRINRFSKGRKKPWNDEEVKNLIEGYKRFGHNWALILSHYEFDNRTNVNLKDKYRNLVDKGILE